MNLTRTALAATENLEAADADGAWSQLYSETPDDPSVALNRAINRLLRVDDLSARATNASLEEAERKGARAQLPDAIADARQSVGDYATTADNPVIAMWLTSESIPTKPRCCPAP